MANRFVFYGCDEERGGNQNKKKKFFELSEKWGDFAKGRKPEVVFGA